ncbi:hypothetical protein [Dyella sp. ASV21]|uniref:hypothetical protein n=1 Tax=Dyella sp. ASV21 TaxID=2795114 RepID=UPI0018EBEDE4|nr:hypothetical protein [Dyella sp. ASV21]
MSSTQIFARSVANLVVSAALLLISLLTLSAIMNGDPHAHWSTHDAMPFSVFVGLTLIAAYLSWAFWRNRKVRSNLVAFTICGLATLAFIGSFLISFIER